ncbi:MAG TPA: 2-oxo-4-hydroxy-4-carboxy-5-ureidoimidazoline decarboxylase, partial [Rhizomicrobium sp.]|nr:2-oxo-4-hydroxy-4-carboxy-5-ureidoimidazoline decarboxylase [Rhizomicrobium sp.]
DAGGRDAQRQLVLAHPDLANRLRTAPLTSASASEQAGAGLDRCTPDEFDEFVSLNQTYRSKFGIPFIKAVRGFSRGQILDEFRRRLANDADAEFATAIEEIHKIALLRLTDLIEQDPHD